MTEKILAWNPHLTEELDEKGWSPLHIAAYVGSHPKIVRQLAKSKPRVVYLGLRNHGNRTALHVAAGRGHVSIVKELVCSFPDCCEKVDDKGNNVLHLIMPKKIFASSGLLNIRWLRAKGLMNQKNAEGETPLNLLQHSSSSSPPGRTTPFSKLLIWFRMKLNWRSSSSRVAMPLLEIEEDSLEIKEESDSSKSRESGEEIISRMQKTIETHMVVAALIATVSFTAGFTPPGGFIQSGSDNEGMAVLWFPNNGNTTTRVESNSSTQNATAPYVVPMQHFKYFMVADSLALVLSVSAIGVYFYAFLSIRKKPEMEFYLYYGTVLTVAAMAAMVIAFVSGVEAVTESGLVSNVFSVAFYMLLVVTCGLKITRSTTVLRAAWDLYCRRSWLAKIFIFSFMLVFLVAGICVVNIFLGWGAAFGFPMLLFTFLLRDYVSKELL